MGKEAKVYAIRHDLENDHGFTNVMKGGRESVNTQTKADVVGLVS